MKLLLLSKRNNIWVIIIYVYIFKKKNEGCLDAGKHIPLTSQNCSSLERWS